MNIIGTIINIHLNKIGTFYNVHKHNNIYYSMMYVRVFTFFYNVGRYLGIFLQCREAWDYITWYTFGILVLNKTNAAKWLVVFYL